MNNTIFSGDTDRQTAMDIKLVVVDETQFYPAEITKTAGRVFQTYAYDASRGFHACDITPSFDLHPLNRTPANYLEDREAREALHEVLAEANAHEQPRSWYCHAVRRIPDTHKKDYQIVMLDDDEPYDVQLERVLDHLRGNVQLELPAHAH